MSNDRLLRINGLNDEVRELHPLLKVLFPRLPHINAVEYRQGAREMGADFVVEKKDETIQSVEYIGVIVKTGKIRQNHAEVERQIEECELERTFGGGKKKIALTEIWVVSNDSISQGAQDKIHHKYKNKSIKFIPGEKLLELVNRFYPEYWTDVSIRVGEYFRTVISKAGAFSAGSSLLGGEAGVHVEQELIASKGSFSYSKKARSKKFTIESAMAESRFMLVEASMGAGKSTLLARAAAKLATPEAYNASGTVPILYSVKDVADTHGGNVSALVGTVRQLLELPEVRCVVFLDGLDELNLEGHAQTELINNLKESVLQDEGVSLVVSTRSLAVEIAPTIEKEFKRFTLPPFSVKQVVSLVDAICRNEGVKTRLLRDLEKSNLFKVLPRTPISAILLAKLLKENVHEIPSTMTELYGKYMELVMGRWDMSKGLQSQTEYEVIHHVTVNIARYVIDNSLDTFSVAEARDMFIEYVASRNLKIDGARTFEKLLERSEVFTVLPDGGAMSFRHRTFAEYFYAVGLDRDGVGDLADEVFAPYWSTIYFFYFGIKRDAADLICEVSSMPMEHAAGRFGRMIVMPNMLLAAYLTPYKEMTQAVGRYFDDVTSLYVEILTQKAESSPFESFSQLDLLCVFTKLISSAHAYEFFAPALKECAVDLYSRPTLNGDRDLAQLFFLNSALAAIGDKHAFETLISDYGSAIPLPLRVGIIEHSKDVGLKTDIVSRYAKRFEKSAKTNPAMARAIDSIVKQPISALLKS